MDFVQSIPGYNHLWAVKEEDKETDELSLLFKARNWDRTKHASWLRIYAIRIDPNVYIVTGGAIKLTAKMQDREHTQIELEKLNKCRNFLIDNGVFDQDSFLETINEE